MTTIKASFRKLSPDGSREVSAVSNVIARLIQIDAPDDRVRLISSKIFRPSEDGYFEFDLAPTEANQAYRLELLPASDTSNPRTVKVPSDFTIVNWEDLVDVNPSTFAPFASDSGDSGGGSPAPIMFQLAISEEELLMINYAAMGLVNIQGLLDDVAPGANGDFTFHVNTWWIPGMGLVIQHLITGYNPVTARVTTWANNTTYPDGTWNGPWQELITLAAPPKTGTYQLYSVNGNTRWVIYEEPPVVNQ